MHIPPAVWRIPRCYFLWVVLHAMHGKDGIVAFLFMMVESCCEIGHVTWHLHVHCSRDYHRWCESSLCWSLWCCNHGEICHVTIHIIVFLSWRESLVVRDFTVSHIGHVFGKPGMGHVMIGGIVHGCCDGVIHRGCEGRLRTLTTGKVRFLLWNCFAMFGIPVSGEVVSQCFL